ncbi:hypothetical protein [uncultured Deefgea sp.]|uniref:hypothetical protein n=1 Tax=uncultured Deefgea sp. TaxID=1304914 RepID=UPI00261C1806|nr:hypothetical protein [uncultured Deefgea sp.]
MGGIGSGWHSHSGKAKTQNYRYVDIRRWQRDGLLTGSGFDWSWTRNAERIASISAIVAENAITLQYRIKRDGEWQDVNCKIRLGTSACNLGEQTQLGRN